MTTKNTLPMVNDLKVAFEQLPIRDAKAVKREIIEQMGWCPATFKAKINGFRELRKTERTVLKILFESYDINF